MASEEDEGDDGMGSLFEGMVLFNPTTVTTTTITSNTSQSAVAPPPPSPDDQAEDDAPSPSDDSAVSHSHPLDENLFSDLTLITTTPLQTLTLGGGLHLQLQPQSDPSSTTPSAVTISTATTSSTLTEARQIGSTRKKKRAGLRIGYGRDSAIPGGAAHCHSPQLPPSPPAAADADDDDTDQITITSGGGGAPVHQEKEQKRYDIAAAAKDVNVLSDKKPFEFFDSSRTSTYDAGLKQIGDSVSAASSSSDLREEEQEDHDDNQLLITTSTTSPIELISEQIRAQISDRLKCAREAVVSVSVARKDSIRRRRKATENLNTASTMYKALEKQLEEACEAEDFEAAERVSESLASAEKDKELSLLALKEAEADCDAVDYKMQMVLESQIAAEEECATLLESFAKDAANNADLVLKNAEVISSKEMDKWLTSTEALEVKKIEMEIETHLINDVRLVLKESIDHTVNDDRRERELLCKRKEMLTEELEKLLALVKEKEAEIAENNSNIEKVDQRINDVVSSFQEVQSSIDTKYYNLQSGLGQMELENEALHRKKNEIDNFISQEEGRGAKIRELANISVDEANMYQELVGLQKSLEQFILKSNEHKVRLAKTEEQLSEDVKMLRQEVSAARASLQDLSSTKSSIQQEIESFKQRVLFIDKRVPELEAEKKVAATARNFKEAARIATEAKMLCVEKDGVQNNRERAMLDIGKLEEEIGNTVNRLQETEAQISSKEMDLSMARFQRLHLISRVAIAERSTALELGDFEEADILLAEAKAADFEASKFQPVSNCKEEISNLPKHFISMELVCNLDRKQLAELVASVQVTAL